MFKFLRKYNKTLLAVFGVLLMITFLIPTAFSQMSQNAGASGGTYATVGDGQRISGAEWSRYQREMELLERMTRGVIPGIGEIKSPEHWYLLVREAEQAGLVPEIAVQNITREELAAFQERDPELLARLRAHIAGVIQLFDLYSTSGLYSDRQVRADAERLFHTVTARMVVLQGNADQSDLQPTEQQLQEQMNKYADKLPGEGEKGFGYKLPDRVKIEWLTVPYASVQALVERSPDMDTVEQRRHWKQNPRGNLPPYPADAGSKPVPPEVRSDLLKDLTAKKVDDFARWAADAVRLPQRGLPEKDGYLVLPEDWASKRKPLPQLAEELRAANAGLDLPEYAARGDAWLTVDELVDLPGIGRASTDKIGGRTIALTEMVKAAKEFGGNPGVIVQAGVAAPPLKDAQGNLYIFRITQADPAHKPASLDEVRDQVTRDLKRQDNYQQLKKSLEDIQANARQGGLLTTALAHDTIVQPPAGVYLWSEFTVQMMLQYQLPLRPNSSAPLPVIGQDREATEAIIDHALALPKDKPADQLSPEQRIFAVPADDKLALLVVEITQQQPLTRESFDRLAQMNGIEAVLVAEETTGERSGIETAFEYETLAKRNNFVLKNPPRKEDEPAGDTGNPNSQSNPEPSKAASAG